jgi:hypothetical protein
MTAAPDGPPPRELDALPTASIGTALAGGASLVWPELLAGAVSLAVLTAFVVWLRALRTLRQRRVTGYRPLRLLPLLVLGGAGWSAEVLVGPAYPAVRALLLGAVSVGLWLLAGSPVVGI